MKEYIELYVKPFFKEWDKSNLLPIEAFKKAGDFGLLGMIIPKKYGGSELTYTEYSKAIEELAQVDPSIALSIASHNSLSTNHIYKFGNEEQKQKYLPKLVSGEYIGCWALSEEEAGSDASNIQCEAKKVDDGWIINGRKKYVTHGKASDIIVVTCKTNNKLSTFIVEKNNNVKIGKTYQKLGMNASETSELIFDHCFVPDSNLLGNENTGLKQALTILDGGRISIAALSLGIAKGAFELALVYSKKRIQFDKPIIDNQSIGFKLAEFSTKIQAAELLINKACEEFNTKNSSMCKLFSSELCVEVANEVIQILGGNGYTNNSVAEKYLRDSKLCTIGEGTSEIQKLVILRHL